MSRDGSRQVFAKTRRDETLESRRDKYRDRKRDKKDVRRDTIRDFEYSKVLNRDQFETGMSLSRKDETLLISNSRDEMGRDSISRLVSPRNETRLSILCPIWTVSRVKITLILPIFTFILCLYGFWVKYSKFQIF